MTKKKELRKYSTFNSQDRIYVAGKISDLPIDEYIYNFERSVVLIEKYFKPNEFKTIINPVELGDVFWSWEKNMAYCLSEVVNSNIVILLPNWNLSKGARLEYAFAKKEGKQVYFINKNYTFIYEEI